jgi:protein TonB
MKTIFILSFLFSLSTFVYSQELALEKESHTSIYDTVDVDAEFPGGTDSLRRYIIDNIRMDSIIGFTDNEMYNKVFVRFVVNREGIVERATIDRASDYCPPCNKEALRLVRSMPKWSPGLLNGQPVAMYFRLPIIFSIQ